MGKSEPRAKYDTIPIGGAGRGISSNRPHKMPRGYVQQLDNYLFHGQNVRTRLGWETVADGLEDNGSYPGAASGGVDNTLWGTFVDYSSNDTGKIMVFEKMLITDSATTQQFANATSNTLARQDALDWLGCLYYASTWFAYNEDKLYSINISTGVATEEVEWSADIGTEYGPIIRCFVRFGQMWVVTKEDRIFWSRTAHYSVAGTNDKDEYPIEQVWNEWQELKPGSISSVESVEALTYDEHQIVGRNYHIQSDDNIVYCVGQVADFSVGDEWYVKKNGVVYPVNTIDTGGVNLTATTLYNDHVVGGTQIRIPKDSAYAFRAFEWAAGQSGYEITITEAGKSTTTAVLRNEETFGNYQKLFLRDALADSYTSSAVVTLSGIVTIDFNSNLGYSVKGKGATLVKDVWTTLTLDTDYEVETNPDTNADADGHIKLLPTQAVTTAEALRCDFTGQDNDWFIGSSGWIDVAADKGNTIDVIEGPGGGGTASSGILYVFKDNGDIYALIGMPAPDGSRGNMQAPQLIASGIRARKGSIQVSREGIYFGALVGINYHVYFIPHGEKLLAEGQVPVMTADYVFDNDIPFSNSTYTIYEKTAIVDGDHYLITFPNSTSGLPTTNDYSYLCHAYRGENKELMGRWSRMTETAETEYESGLSVTVADGPSTQGYYIHDGKLCKVYTLKTGHAYAGATRYYELARYGWYAGAEECKDKYVYTLDDGDGTYTSGFATEFVWPIIRYGMVRIADRFTLKEINVDVDHVGGSNGDGIDMSYSIYRDLGYTTPATGFPVTLSDMTDDTTNLNIINPRLECNILATYVQPYFVWDNVKYRNQPAYIEFNGCSLKVSILSPKGKRNEEEG